MWPRIKAVTDRRALVAVVIWLLQFAAVVVDAVEFLNEFHNPQSSKGFFLQKMVSFFSVTLHFAYIPFIFNKYALSILTSNECPRCGMCVASSLAKNSLLIMQNAESMSLWVLLFSSCLRFVRFCLPQSSGAA